MNFILTRMGIILLSTLITIVLFVVVLSSIKEIFNLKLDDLSFSVQVGFLYLLTLVLYLSDVLITEKICKKRECEKRHLNVTAVQHFVSSLFIYSIALALFYLLIDNLVIITGMGLFFATVTVIEYFYKKPYLK